MRGFVVRCKAADLVPTVHLVELYETAEFLYQNGRIDWKMFKSLRRLINTSKKILGASFNLPQEIVL